MGIHVRFRYFKSLPWLAYGISRGLRSAKLTINPGRRSSGNLSDSALLLLDCCCEYYANENRQCRLPAFFALLGESLETLIFASERTSITLGWVVITVQCECVLSSILLSAAEPRCRWKCSGPLGNEQASLKRHVGQSRIYLYHSPV